MDGGGWYIERFPTRVRIHAIVVGWRENCIVQSIMVVWLRGRDAIIGIYSRSRAFVVRIGCYTVRTRARVVLGTRHALRCLSHRM